MGIKINAYPEFNKELKDKIGYSSSATCFSYGEDKSKLTLEPLDISNKCYYLSDDKNKWDRETDNINIYKTFSIKQPKFLFGKEGIACENAEIGIALLWYSYDSKQRGVIKSEQTIKNQKEPVKLILEYSFSSAMFRGCVTFEPVFFIKKTGKVQAGEEFLANKIGMLLGAVEDKETLYLDGESSIFPIYEIEDKNGPLWSITYLCGKDEDLISKRFDEAVSINLNKSHPEFENCKNNKQFFIEVLSAALVSLIYELKDKIDDDWYKIEDGIDLEDGSVGSALNYFISGLEFDFSSVYKLSESIRLFLQGRM